MLVNLATDNAQYTPLKEKIKRRDEMKYNNEKKKKRKRGTISFMY